MKTRKNFKLPESIRLRNYQVNAKDTAIQLITEQPSTWHLFSSPTGTGKSLIELKLLEEIPQSILVTPRLEIIAGMMDKLKHDVDGISDTELINLSKQYGIITPVRLRNILAKGELDFYPSVCIVDEAHHDLADTYQDINMYLNGVPKVGFTATPYRGTPRATQKFHQQWHDTINVCITLAEAIERGYCSLPSTKVWPLIDDDLINVMNGEFKVASTEYEVCDKISAIVTRCNMFFDRRQKLWDRPTMFSVPTTRSAIELTNALLNAGLPAMRVTQDTPRSMRALAFERTVKCETALVQIDVVSEGVDLPIRRLIDLKPTMSPVRWVQQIGRIMRPITDGEDAPEYICCCRNLERHCYLMEGMFPTSTILEAQTTFSAPSVRSGVRAVGLEGLGRFTITPVSLLDGTTVFTYNLVHVDGFKRTEYFVVVHPNYPDPVYGVKESTKDSNNEIKWGRWRLVESLPDLKGCQTAKAWDLTERQSAKWTKECQQSGLNPHKKITAREFQILPFLQNCGLNFRKH